MFKNVQVRKRHSSGQAKAELGPAGPRDSHHFSAMEFSDVAANGKTDAGSRTVRRFGQGLENTLRIRVAQANAIIGDADQPGLRLRRHHRNLNNWRIGRAEPQCVGYEFLENHRQLPHIGIDLREDAMANRCTAAL
jgi:hypothetical protein